MSHIDGEVRGRQRERIRSALLERPPNERPMMLVVTGYPAADARVPGLRCKSLEEVVSFR